MDNSQELLSNLTIYSKYARYIPELQRRETWDEIVTRNLNMHKKKYPHLSQDIDYYGQWVREKKVLGSMRSYQFGGRAIERSPIRGYNCSALAIDNIKAFSEIMFLLLSGCGVGYSVQYHDVGELPEIKKPKGSSRFLIGDSVEGWSDAIRVLIKAYFEGSFLPDFDFSDIRPKGTPLKVSGGKAPGPEPLKQCLLNIHHLLKRLHVGDKIEPIQAHDIVCFIAQAVLAGGIRRSALACLFSIDDYFMRKAKSGKWWEVEPQRALANNSAVLLRYRLKKKDFDLLWKTMQENQSGEPGFFLSNDRKWLTNPCYEAALRHMGLCNLCEINGGDLTSQEELNMRARVASFFGTLQAGYTDFHYLREGWRKTGEKDALLGISITGVSSMSYKDLSLTEAANTVVEMNNLIAPQININPSTRMTLLKPSGTTSLVLGTSSGIHAWHSPFYLRRIRFNKNEAIFQYLEQYNRGIIEQDLRDENNGIVTLPIAAQSGVTRNKETALDLLERVAFFHKNWVLPGHVNGNNTHSISATVSIREHEWKEAGEWMWENRDSYNNLSILPYDGGTYVQAPFEEITEEEYKKRVKAIGPIDLTQVKEYDDETELRDNLACAGGTCDL